MANTLGKNLNLWFTKIKRPTPSQSPFPEDHHRPSSTSTSTTTTLFKNFNSLYDFTLDTTTTTTTASNDVSSSESDNETATIPDFATAFASQRFFFSSPGSSNSIIDSSSTSSVASTSSSSSSTNPLETDTLVGDSIAIPTYSPDPFVDFRRSMQEMVEARNLIDVREDWDSLHELLMSYLALNPKSTHKFIVGAFSDLLVSLISSSAGDGCNKSIYSKDNCKISRRSI